MAEYIPGELADNAQGGREYEDWYYGSERGPDEEQDNGTEQD